jgi:hypothetical protein
MTAKKPNEKSKARVDPSKYKGQLKPVGGSESDEWNTFLVNQVIQTLWVFPNASDDNKEHRKRAAIDGLIGICPRDECEGMIAAQLIACHNAAMECYRRAMLTEQTFEGRQENLNQANKLSRTHATLLEALNRHRGKGQQKVTVEHVHVHEGGQAIVGNVETTGGGVPNEIKEQPMQLPMHRARRCLARTRSGRPCESPAMPNGRCRMHGGTSTGAPKGNKNAFKHGRYTAEAVRRRPEVSLLVQTARRICNSA